MPSPPLMHLLTHRQNRESKHRVRFTEFVEVNEYQPLDPELKSALYYSREEMHDIRRRTKAAIAMRRQHQQLGAQRKMRNIQICPAYANYCAAAREQSEQHRKWEASKKIAQQFQSASHQDSRRAVLLGPSEMYSAIVS